MIYLDNAATTFPKPPTVMKACADAMRFGANPGRSGYRLSLNASQKLYECRQKASDFFNLLNVENCILTPSCTVSLNTVIYGVLKKGDHVVISSLEHNSVLRPIERLKDMGIINYDVAEVFEKDDDRTIESFRKCMNDKTKLVICTHASNVFGIKLPVERISALCKFYSVLFCVDTAQSAGVVPIDIKEISADFLCVPGHKGLYGPMGTGFLLINTEKIPDSLYQGGTGSSTIGFKEPDMLPDKYEAGTLNLYGFAGLSKGIDFVNSKTTLVIRNHELGLVRRLHRKLSTIKDVELYTKEPDIDSYVPLISFNLKGKDPNDVSRILDKKFGIAVRSGFHCSPIAHKYMGTGDRGTIRVCPSAFTSIKEIDALINAIYLIVNGKK